MASKPKTTKLSRKPTTKKMPVEEFLFQSGFFDQPATAADVRNWVVALDQLDRSKGNDKKRLCDMLRSGCELPLKVRWYLADLIERRIPRPTKGNPRTALYNVNENDLKLIWAIHMVRVACRAGLPLKKALEKVAKHFDLDETKFADAYNGKLGSLNRTKARLLKLQAGLVQAGRAR
jgi:hypothetical protein